MFRRMTRLASRAALLAVMVTTSVRAYCPARSCDPDAAGGADCELDPQTGCSLEGLKLHRAGGCLRFAIKQGSSDAIPGLSDSDIEAAVVDAFATWSSVDCGDGPPAIDAQSMGVVAARDIFTCDAVPEANVDLWVLSDELSMGQVVTPTTGTVAGATHPSYLLESGVVFDADVELNTLWLLVQDEDELLARLRVVVLHEAGHVLGMAHSNDEDAVMFESYSVVPERVLTADDIEGICALYPPQRTSCEQAASGPAAFDRNGCEEAVLAQQAPPQDGGAPPSQTVVDANSGCTMRAPAGNRDPFAALAFVLLLWQWRQTRQQFAKQISGKCA